MSVDLEMAKRKDHDRQMSSLAAYIDGELSSRGWSTDRAAGEAAKRGHYITGETIRKARRDLYKERLPVATVEAIAAAFGVKPERIQQLDEQRWALGTSSGADTEAAILADPGITERDKHLLLEMYRAMQDGGIGRPPSQRDQGPNTALG